MKGGPAIHLFEEEYEKRFGVKPLLQTPDCVQLARALKATGENYRELVVFYLTKSDPFLENQGYSARMISAPIINAFRLQKAKSTQQRRSSNDYKDRLREWQEENCVSEAPSIGSLAPLPGGEPNE